LDFVGGEDTVIFRVEEDPVDQSPSSIVSTGDKGAMMGDSEGDSRDDFSSTSLEWTEIVLPVARSGRDWVCTVCIRRGDTTRSVWWSLSSFSALVAFDLSGFLGGTDGV
jgi:hypothetical protein